MILRTNFCRLTLVGESDLKDWHRIAQKLPGRSNKDCRKRWCNNVTEGLRKGQWEEDEDSRLESGIQKHGYQFASLFRYCGRCLMVFQLGWCFPSSGDSKCRP